jgi:hypothetical protein
MKNKNILLAALVGLSSLFATFTAVAQEEAKSSPFNASVSLYSRYIWRGINLGGNAASVQPSLTFTKGGLTVGAWGAFSMSPINDNGYGRTEYQEIDLYATYTYKMFSATLTDYFIPYDAAKSSEYSDFGNDTTSHVGEIALSFNGVEGLPLTFLFAMNLYGYDARKENGKDLVMSKYVELGYTIDADGVPVKIFAGAALDKPAVDGTTGYYLNKKAGLINVGFTATKTVQVNDKFSFPLAATLAYNPDAKGIFFAMGITF